MAAHFEVVVIGGGPVGAAAALALHTAGHRVLLIEARAAGAAATDLRPLALSHGSRLILERLRVWDALEVTEIERIHVSQRGRFGRTLLTAPDAGLPALGYVTHYGALLGALEDAVARAGLPVARGARVASIAHDASSAHVELATAGGPDACYAGLVAVADGTAETAGFAVRGVDYGQSALTARVDVDHPHGDVAYERFTPEGPLALLPFGRGYAVVWTTFPERAEWLCDAAPQAFLARLQGAFGDRAGFFVAVEGRAVHRVRLRVSDSARFGRAVAIGNAAQALHPVAGQGFNLGLRDAWELAGEVRAHGAHAEQLPTAFAARRRVDRAGGIGFTHALVSIFSNDLELLGLARGVGLTLLDCVPPAKDFVVRRMEFGVRG